MKNSELLAASKHTLLGSVDKQRRFILQMASAPMTCPHCGKRCSEIEAYGTGEIDDYPVDTTSADNEYHCPHCTTQLHFCLPLMGSPYWMTEKAWQVASQEGT